jgi:hypothetical protein
VDASARISWAAPSDNYKTITAYAIEVRNAAGTLYHADTTHCDGASAAVVSSLYCEVPVAVLRAAPYDLALQDLVVARVRAINELGAGPFSDANTDGALI